MKRKKNRHGKNSIMAVSLIGIVLIVLICIFLQVRTQKLKNENLNDEKKIAELQTQLQSEEDRSDEIDEYEKYVNTKQFIEDMARQKLGLIYPDEIIFKPEEK